MSLRRRAVHPLGVRVQCADGDDGRACKQARRARRRGGSTVASQVGPSTRRAGLGQSLSSRPPVPRMWLQRLGQSPPRPVPHRPGHGPLEICRACCRAASAPAPSSPPTPAVPATALAARSHRASHALPLTARPSRRLLTVVRLRQGPVHRLSGRNEGRVPCATRCGMHLCTCLWCVVNVQEHVFVACCAHSRCRRSRGRLGHADRRRGPSLRLWRGRSTIRRRRFRWRLGDCGSFCGRGFAPPHHANHFAHATLRPFAVG